MSLADVKKNTQERMTKSLETLKADLAKVRTGRAHTGILDHVMVDYYGSPTALTQVANVTLIDARTIGVQPYEKKMASTIEKAIRDAGKLRVEGKDYVVSDGDICHFLTGA